MSSTFAIIGQHYNEADPMRANEIPGRELQALNERHATHEEQTLALINELDAIKLQFESIHRQLTQNSVLTAEHARHKENQKNGQEVDISRKFNSRILHEFTFTNTLYQAVKAKLPSSMKEEISEIETTIFDAAKVSKKEFDSLIFYPELQSKHMQYASDHAPILDREKKEISAAQTSIMRQRMETQTRFNNFYKASGLLSIIGIGIPLLLIGAIANLIDKLKATLTIQKLQKELIKVSNQQESNYHPQLPQLKMQIENIAEARLKQRFFRAAKAQTPLATELDVYIPKEQPRR